MGVPCNIEEYIDTEKFEVIDNPYGFTINGMYPYKRIIIRHRVKENGQ